MCEVVVVSASICYVVHIGKWQSSAKWFNHADNHSGFIWNHLMSCGSHIYYRFLLWVASDNPPSFAILEPPSETRYYKDAVSNTELFRSRRRHWYDGKWTESTCLFSMSTSATSWPPVCVSNPISLRSPPIASTWLVRNTPFAVNDDWKVQKIMIYDSLRL